MDKLKKGLVGSILISVILAVTLTYVWATTPTTTFYISTGVYPGAPTYTIWTEGSGASQTYYCKRYDGHIPTFSGSTNASYVIQQIINALTSGGSIFFLRGTYSLSANITVLYPINFDSEPGTIFKATAVLSPIILIGNSATTWDKAVFSNFKVDLNGNATTGIRITGARHVKFESVDITNAKAHSGIGLDLYATTDYIAWCHFETCTFYYLQTCVTIRASGSTNTTNNNLFENCQFIASDTPKLASHFGVNWTAGNANNFVNCDFENSYYGLWEKYTNGDIGITMTGTRFEGVHIGAYFNGSTNSYPNYVQISYCYNVDNATWVQSPKYGLFVQWWYLSYPSVQFHPLDNQIFGVVTPGTMWWCNQDAQFEYFNGTAILGVSHA